MRREQQEEDFHSNQIIFYSILLLLQLGRDNVDSVGVSASCNFCADRSEDTVLHRNYKHCFRKVHLVLYQAVIVRYLAPQSLLSCCLEHLRASRSSVCELILVTAVLDFHILSHRKSKTISYSEYFHRNRTILYIKIVVLEQMASISRTMLPTVSPRK